MPDTIGREKELFEAGNFFLLFAAPFRLVSISFDLILRSKLAFESSSRDVDSSLLIFISLHQFFFFSARLPCEKARKAYEST
jgi:hypothetical protein